MADNQPVLTGSAAHRLEQAVELLHVAQPHLGTLLQQGLLPLQVLSSPRRLLPELLRYQRQRQLRFLAEQAQQLQLGYD